MSTNQSVELNDLSINVDKPESFLSPEEIKAAHELVAKINRKYPVKFERSGNQPSAPFKVENWTDIPKDKYRGIISGDINSKAEIITDGNIVYGKAYGSVVAELKTYEVSNYNYILVSHHFPSHDPNVSESRYNAIVTMNVLFKFYVQQLLGLPIG